MIYTVLCLGEGEVEEHAQWGRLDDPNDPIHAVTNILRTIYA